MLRKIARWILFLPLGLLAASIVGLGTFFLGSILVTSGTIGAYVVIVFGVALSSGVFCFVACYVAPNYKQGVALIMTVFSIMFYAITTFSLWDDSVEIHLLTVSHVLGFGVVGIQIFRKKISAGTPI